MMKTKERFFAILGVFLLIVLFSMSSFAMGEGPTVEPVVEEVVEEVKEPFIFSAETPVAMTNPGQSPEIAIVGLLARRANIEITTENFMKVEGLEGMKTLILIIGASGKGLGSAGVDLNSEVNRAKSLIQTAKEKGIRIIGMHLGGSERRGENSMVMIDLITPECEYVVVREDGNEDGYFTKLCEDNNIPLTLLTKTTEVTGVLEALFLSEEEAPCEEPEPEPKTEVEEPSAAESTVPATP